MDIAIGVQGRLGAYLNTMVDELNIDNKGEYLRQLFGKYEEECLVPLLKNQIAPEFALSNITTQCNLTSGPGHKDSPTCIPCMRKEVCLAYINASPARR